VKKKTGPSRFAVWRQILWRPLVRRIVGVYAVLGVLNWFKSEFLPAWLQENLRLIVFIGLLTDLPWYWWAVGFLILLLVLTLEGSYQTIYALQPDADVTVLARCRAAGVQVFAREVKTPAEKQQWLQDYQAWDTRARECLASFPEPTRLRFENLGPLKDASYLGAYDPEHNHRLMILDKQMVILQEIISGK
jgi:hypothetical protein